MNNTLLQVEEDEFRIILKNNSHKVQEHVTSIISVARENFRESTVGLGFK